MPPQPPQPIDPLLQQLLDYGVMPEQIAGAPMIPNSYVDSKWNQDAGAYVPTEMLYAKPSTRLWHGQQMLNMLMDPQFAALGEAYGIPTLDVFQGAEGDAAAAQPAATPLLDAMSQSPDPNVVDIANDIRSGIDPMTIKASIQQLALTGELDQDQVDEYSFGVDNAYNEYADAVAPAEGEGGPMQAAKIEAARKRAMSPVEQAMYEAGLPQIDEQYTADSPYLDRIMPDWFYEKMAQGERQGERNVNRAQRSIRRDQRQTRRGEQDEMKMEQAVSAVQQAVREAQQQQQQAAAPVPSDWREAAQYMPAGSPAGVVMQQEAANYEGQASPWDQPYQPQMDIASMFGASTPYIPEHFEQAPVDYNQQFNRAEELNNYFRQQDEENMRNFVAAKAQEQGRSPSSDATQARVALWRFLGLPG